jgi:hypothetical protein
VTRLKLKEKSGSFELWTQGTSRGFVMAAKGEPGEPHRVTIELYSASGVDAASSATGVFNTLILAMAKATRSLRYDELTHMAQAMKKAETRRRA